MLHKTTSEDESQTHRPNANEFVKMVNIDMDKYTKQTCHNLLHASNVVPWKWYTYTHQCHNLIHASNVVPWKWYTYTHQCHQCYSGLAVTFVTLVTLILFWLIDWLIDNLLHASNVVPWKWYTYTYQCHNLLHASNVVPWKWYTYTYQCPPFSDTKQ